ncbi:sugar transferase [Herpetosiphon giganteus]|uniref:sugar transferase n=1 Tax=Herpetosiphon giganteus TaxID=2029754 RepID=UPI00195AC78F|nr:sugar transferase [Herpetosiphon giganteus]MBM7845749.1 exopolysaccharide biosynthesis polyprenyl glycosylphosphotransferase [Herpetosiphon giganteus]
MQPSPLASSKRCFDLIVAGLALVLLSPLLLLIAVAIKLTSRGPIFYNRPRVGLAGREFPFYKFRTMVVNAERQGLGLEIAYNDQRITRVGQWLRRWSCDELPQLLNVLRGEMSLIGPRPSLPEQVARYTPAQRQRLAVRPGITGWAQVNGRNDIDWEARIQLDCWYIAHWSWRLDLLILWRTIGAIVRPVGIYGRDGVAKDLRGK